MNRVHTSSSGASGVSSSSRNKASSSSSSPTSLIEQWKVDARGAVEDAYANYVLGDDAGESARLVLVATPSDDLHAPLRGPGGPDGPQQDGGRGGHRNGHGRAGRNAGNSPPNSNPYLASQSLLLNGTNGHSHSMMKYSKKQHATSFTSCGVTFCEVNGRAYVSALDEASAAYKAGVLPQDCVQYAAVLAKEWEEPLDGDFEAISQQALEREDKGQRITFEELKRVLIQGSGLLSPSAIWMGPRPARPVPTTIRIGKVNPCGPMTAAASTTTNDDDDDDVVAYDPNGHGRGTAGTTTDPRPVVLVFRRTRQRPPRAWNVWPNYRLDDECDVACQIIESLTCSGPGSGTAGTRGALPPSKGTTPRQRTKKAAPSPKRRRGRRRRRSSEDDTDGYSSDDDPFDDLDHVPTEEEDEQGGAGPDEDDDPNVEASTIRGMIQKAVGLAFVRSNKVVFGVSVHGGSGIVLARLPDGTWSAPSCIGMLGMGLGLQVGLEVANYIFILQTKEALEHFQCGGSFTLGANVGAAFAGMGREAIGAASVSSALCGISSPVRVIKEDEYTYERDYTVAYNSKPNGAGKRNGASGGPSGPGMESPLRIRDRGGSSVAPIVAYAKSEGLYVGVSLEGSRIFTRGELNARAYKLSSYNHKAVTSFDILTGKILARPPEAESLYALLHSIEFSHEIYSLPPLPRSAIVYNKDGKGDDWTKAWEASSTPILPIDDEEADAGKKHSRDEVDDFSKRFQHFLFGGITVERIVPHHGTNPQRQRQRRTLWGYTPQKGSTRLGFVSKLFSATAKTTNLNTSIIQDIPKSGAGGGRDGGSIISEMDGDEVTLDSALIVSSPPYQFASLSTCLRKGLTDYYSTGRVLPFPIF
jgi:lipid-binding SYLF domain-containing protein